MSDINDFGFTAVDQDELVSKTGETAAVNEEVAKQLKENKAKTGRYSQPFNTLHPIQKGLLVAMPCILIGLFFWLYNYSILAPGPGELYNPEIAAVGLLFALTLIGSLWMVRN